MFGYNYWNIPDGINGMTFDFIAGKNQFWMWRCKLGWSFVIPSDKWEII